MHIRLSRIHDLSKLDLRLLCILVVALARVQRIEIDDRLPDLVGKSVLFVVILVRYKHVVSTHEFALLDKIHNSVAQPLRVALTLHLATDGFQKTIKHHHFLKHLEPRSAQVYKVKNHHL